MADVRDVVTWAHQDLGTYAAGETLSAADVLDGLSALNAVIDQLKAERLAIHHLARTTWTIVASTTSYTVGAGGTINVARPVSQLRAAYYVTATTPVTEIGLGESLTPDEWMGLSQKGQTSTAPARFYYEPTIASGFGTLYLWPVPTVSTLTGVLYAPRQVDEFATVNDTVLLPPGYKRMLRKLLAIELAPSFDRPVSQDLKDAARDAVTVVKRSNVRLSEMRFDGVFTDRSGGWDIETGP